jgi:RNA polymerase sigma-70 factor, ECF subfamily
MDQKTAQEYFLKVYDEHVDAIYRFCTMKTSDAELAHDLSQELFTRLWDTMQKKEAIEFPRALVFTIARNAITDWYRKHKSISLDALEEEGYEAVGDTRNIEADAEHARILSVLTKLSPRHREVISLRFVEGLPPRDIAHILNENVNVVSVRITHALRALRHILEKN